MSELLSKRMRALKITAASIALMASAFIPAYAQTGEQDLLSSAAQIEISRELQTLIEAEYVLEDKVALYSAGISNAIQTGLFDEPMSADQYLASLNTVLQNSFPDRHLGILSVDRYALMLEMFYSGGDDDAEESASHAPSGHAPTGHAPSGHGPEAHAPAAHGPAAHGPVAHSPATTQTRSEREAAGLERLRQLAGITRVSEINRDGLNQIGYVAFERLIGSDQAMQIVANIFSTFTESDRIIIDLRACKGGDVSMVQFISSLFYDEPTHLVTSMTRHGGDFERWTTPHALSAAFADRQLDILISADTFSAGESMAFGFSATDRVRLIGQATGGGGHMNDFFALPHGFGASISVGRTYDPRTGEGWQSTGVMPDIEFEQGHAMSGLINLITEETGHLAALSDTERNIYDVLQSYTHAWYASDSDEMDTIISSDFEAYYSNGDQSQSRDHDAQILATADGMGELPRLYHNRIIDNIQINGDTATTDLILRATTHTLELRMTDDGWRVSRDDYGNKRGHG